MLVLWWCAGLALYAVAAALFRREITMLADANPDDRLPWIGWPGTIPHGAKLLGYWAVATAITGMVCILEALGRRHLYDVLWILPIFLAVFVVGIVPQIKHNRRIRRTL